MRSMNYDTVKSITVKGDTLFGVTESGTLAMFDEILGRWIVRCEPEVLCADRTSTLRSSFVDPGIFERPTHMNSKEAVEVEYVKSPVVFWLALSVMVVGILIATWFFTR